MFLQVIQNPSQVVQRWIVKPGGVAASHHKFMLVSSKVLVVIQLEHVRMPWLQSFLCKIFAELIPSNSEGFHSVNVTRAMPYEIP